MNQISYRLQLIHCVSGAWRELSCLIIMCTPAGVSLSESKHLWLFFILFHKALLTANQAISNQAKEIKMKEKKTTTTTVAAGKTSLLLGNGPKCIKNEKKSFRETLLCSSSICANMSMTRDDQKMTYDKVWQWKERRNMEMKRIGAQSHFILIIFSLKSTTFNLEKKT